MTEIGLLPRPRTRQAFEAHYTAQGYRLEEQRNGYIYALEYDATHDGWVIVDEWTYSEESTIAFRAIFDAMAKDLMPIVEKLNTVCKRFGA